MAGRIIRKGFFILFYLLVYILLSQSPITMIYVGVFLIVAYIGSIIYGNNFKITQKDFILASLICNEIKTPFDQIQIEKKI
jgi:hypothetical protein